jgi:hypothetical protein
MVSNYDAFRAQLSRLLDLIDEQPLENIHRDMLATGIKVARRDGADLVLQSLRRSHPRAFELGEEVLAQLRAADEELESDEVAELEAFVREQLPETL